MHSTGDSEDRPGSYCVRCPTEKRGWHTFIPTPAAVSVDAISLVLEAPEFLSGQGFPDSAVRVAVPLAFPAQRTDRLLLAVDESGGIMLAGFPDPADRGSATAIAGDLVAVTGRLWRQPTPEFLKMVEEPLGRPLATAIAGRTRHDWSGETLLSGVAASLEAGRFPVVLVAAESNAGAREAVAFLAGMNIPVRLIDVAVFTSDGTEVAMPKLIVEANRASAQAPRPAAAPAAQPVVRPTASPDVRRPEAATAQPGTFRPASPAAQPSVARPTPQQPSRDRGSAAPAAPAAEPIRPAPHPGGAVPGPGSKPGVMAGKRPPPKHESGKAGR